MPSTALLDAGDFGFVPAGFAHAYKIDEATRMMNTLSGAKASFRQLFAIVTHSWIIPGLTGFVTTPLMLAKQELSSPSTLAVLLPMLPDDSFLKYFFGAIDFVWIWFLVNLAIGVAVLYKQKTGPVATTLFVIYGMVALIYASIRSL